MSVYTSLKISRSTARDILWCEMNKAMKDDAMLKEMVSAVLERNTLYNCYAIVDASEANDDDRVRDLVR